MRYLCDSVFGRVPEITGLELVMKGQKWEGAYRLDGSSHPRRDKLKVYRFGGRVWLYEEGASVMGLEEWLERYRGVAQGREMAGVLNGEGGYFIPSPSSLSSEVRYVDEACFSGMRAFGHTCNPLYRCLSGWSKLRDAWERYGVCTDSWGNTVYWYRDADGRLCRDKRIRYKEDGHRDKNRGAWSKFKVSDGYVGRCLFGEHLVSGLPTGTEVCVVESEKTALLLSAWTGKVVCATGGKSNIRLIRRITDRGLKVVLYPDVDAEAEWKVFGRVVQWWDDMPPVGDTEDIGDGIFRRVYGKK